MVVPHVDVHELHLYGMCDWHIGSPDCDEKLLHRDLDIIANDEAARIILLGDLMNNDLRNSHGDVYYQTMPPSQQKRKVIEMLQPLKDKILVIISGNHEGRTQEDAGLMQDVADMLDVPFAREEVLIKIPVGHKKKNNKPVVYTGYFIHGHGGGRLIGSKALNLTRLKDIVLADLYGCGHTHTILAHKDTYYVPDLHNNNVLEMTRYYVNFGSYQRRGLYPARKGLPGQCLGTPVIRLSGCEKKITVEL